MIRFENPLFQWDTNQFVTFDDQNVTAVDFQVGDSDCLRVIPEDGRAAVPNQVLTHAGTMFIFVCTTDDHNNDTLKRYVTRVQARPKPSDYVYTETEVQTLAAYETRFRTIESAARKEASNAADSADAAEKAATEASKAAGVFKEAHLKGVTISEDGNSATFLSQDGSKKTFAPKTSLTWGEIDGKPSTFPPSTHTHSYNELKEKPTIPAPYDDAEIRKAIRDTAADVAKLMPNGSPAVGKLARVAEVFEDGTFRMEWVDAQSGGGVSDVKVNGNSVVEDGVASIPKATSSALGVVRGETAYSVGVTAEGQLRANVRDQTVYDGLSNYSFVGKGTLENIKTGLVGRALADASKAAYTPEQQKAACERLGAEPKQRQYELLNEFVVTETTPAIIELTSDNLGRPYSLNGVFMAIKLSAEGIVPTQMTIYTKSGNTYLTWEFARNAVNNGLVCATVNNNNGLTDSTITVGTSGTMSNVQKRMTQFNNSVFLPITFIGITDGRLPVGTTIKIYGIRV